MRDFPFTRPTITAAIELLGDKLSQAKFDVVIIRLQVEGYISIGNTKSVTAKVAQLGAVMAQYGSNTISTLDGAMSLAEATVREAVLLCRELDVTPSQARFTRGLSLDGYIIDFNNSDNTPILRSALPHEIDLPSTDNEVNSLLNLFNFTTSLGHLNQSIEAHTRGDWAAANSQVRTFMESLFDSIAHHIDQENYLQLGSSENRRAWLASKTFLSVARNEWSQDGKNFVNGFFKMLHTEGSHPGLSDEDHCTFRLHLCLITSRMFLRRLKNGG